LIAGSEFVNLI